MAVLKELILTVSTLQGCGSLEKTGFNSLYFARGLGKSCVSTLGGCVVLIELILTVSTLRRVGSLEKNSIFNSELNGYFERVWWF